MGENGQKRRAVTREERSDKGNKKKKATARWGVKEKKS